MTKQPPPQKKEPSLTGRHVKVVFPVTYRIWAYGHVRPGIVKFDFYRLFIFPSSLLSNFVCSIIGRNPCPKRNRFPHSVYENMPNDGKRTNQMYIFKK